MARRYNASKVGQEMSPQKLLDATRLTEFLSLCTRKCFVLANFGSELIRGPGTSPRLSMGSILAKIESAVNPGLGPGPRISSEPKLASCSPSVAAVGPC